MARKIPLAAAVAATGIWAAVVLANDVNSGHNVSTPAPPPAFIVTSPPRVAIVPGTDVYRVPSASFNLFLFGGRYYSFHNGAWFLAPSYNGPWKLITAERVPKPVRAVPASYYRIPPGEGAHAGVASTLPGHAKGPKSKKGGED